MNATTDNLKVDSPSLKGSTYSIEIGANTQIKDNMTIGINLDGYLGKREGVGGKINWGLVW